MSVVRKLSIISLGFIGTHSKNFSPTFKCSCGKRFRGNFALRMGLKQIQIGTTTVDENGNPITPIPIYEETPAISAIRMTRELSAICPECGETYTLYYGIYKAGDKESITVSVDPLPDNFWIE